MSVAWLLCTSSAWLGCLRASLSLQFSDALRELQKTAQYGSTISQAEFS
jgi:hypothetical protein